MARDLERQRAADAHRRVLVGARVPRDDYERYRIAAMRTQRSLYRYVIDALDHETQRVMERRPP